MDEPPRIDPRTDRELLDSLRRDRTAALGALFDRYGSLVYGLALAVLASPPEAEDLTQEIFLALLERCPYDPERGSLGGFLISFTRSRAIDRVRSRSRRARLGERWGRTAPRTTEFNALDQLSLAERSARVRAALASLPASQRAVLELAYFQDLSQSEIAVRLETPLGTVKSWTRNGLLHLRGALDDLVG